MQTNIEVDGGTGRRAGSSQAARGAELKRILRGDGVQAALQSLNAGTRFRFTGLYRVEPPLLRNIRLFDRENPTLNVSGTVSPLTIGYCGIVCATGAAFVTEDARRDARLVSHPARQSMLSYCGVPIRSRGGMPWGTLCHFDFRRRLVAPGEAELLASLVPVFAEWLADQALLD